MKLYRVEYTESTTRSAWIWAESAELIRQGWDDREDPLLDLLDIESTETDGGWDQLLEVVEVKANDRDFAWAKYEPEVTS